MGMLKLHKVLNNTRFNQVNQLELKQIISNVRTATYNLRKYLAQIIKQLSESEYIIKNRNSFTNGLKQMKIPSKYTIVSFNLV